MVLNPCVIDDEEINALRLYVLQQGTRLDQMVSRYVSILKTVKSIAIMEGTASDSLQAFIGYAEELQTQIGLISTDAHTQLLDFQARVSEADQYSF